MKQSYLSNLGKAFGFSLLFIFVVGCTLFPASLAGSDGQPLPQGVKITAAPDGMIAIPLKQLQPYGFTSANQQEWILSFRGKAIPFWLLGENPPQLVFYSPPTRSQYWKDNVFLLQSKSSFSRSPDPELSFIWQLEAPPVSFWEKQPVGSVLSYFSIEQNLLYQSLAEGDHWFWSKLVSGQEQSITVKLEVPPTVEIFLRFALYSATEAPVQPDHALQLKINDGVPQEVLWDGKGYRQIELFVPAENFHQGENQLSLSVPNLDGVFAQVSFLDRIDLYSWRMFPPQAQTSQFKFLALDHAVLAAVDSLDLSLGIWNVDDPLNPLKLEKGQTLSGVGELHPYVAVLEGAFQTPIELKPLKQITTQGQERENAGIAYLAIGPAELLEPLKPLLDLRTQEGLATEAVSVEEIVDQHYGFAEPQAVRAYLAARMRQHPSLRYILLVGDATYDPAQNITKAELNRLPTFFVDTIFGGQTSTELPFAVLDQPGLDFLDSEPSFQPQVAVGRLPASSPQQVRQWVAKVVDYEKNGKKPRSEAVLAIADPHETYFSREATDFTELWDEDIRKDLFLPQVGETDLKEKIQDYFRQDYPIIAYFGHGAIDLWGKDEIFTAQQAQMLTGQSSYPIVLNFTCLTGYYIHPEVLSLTEALLWNPKGGAVLVIAPTSLTLADDQGFLWKAFVESYQEQGKERIGEVWRDAIAKIALNNIGVRDVVLTYTLFGDPALNLP